MDVDVDEKKPLDEDLDADDGQPDPDETLMLDQGHGRVWLVRIPKSLMERWAAVDSETQHLASMRLYPEDIAKNTGHPRMLLFLPPNKDPRNGPNQPDPPVDPSRPQFSYFTENPVTEADVYELEMLAYEVDNQVVVAERPKDPTLSAAAVSAANTTIARSRTTILTGRIKHECALKPILTETYRRQMLEREEKNNTPAQVTKILDADDLVGGRGALNKITSGAGPSNTFSDFVKAKPKPIKGNFERMARIPRNQLLDLLFTLFREQSHWSIKPLREKTQQPEAYLKEVLGEIGFLHRSGEFNGTWELKETFKDGGSDQVKAEGNGFGKLEEQDAVMSTPSQHMDVDDDDDDDDDDDMEEVS
ncbi:transcription initiation factor IIF, beta subunit-domain-containing protein [Flagelloscypha sp. PMI_526]|nr:transcription initiation factor IIF, beta subunit-domain-containing protein [Flagelloscypha sp. PMI_526]